MQFATQEELKILKSDLESVLKRINSMIISEKETKDKVEDTIREVCRYSGLAEKEMFSTQKQGRMFYKQILIYILTDYCNLTLQSTSDRLNLVSHASAKKHRDKMRWWMDNPQYAPSGLVVATNNIINNLGL